MDLERHVLSDTLHAELLNRPSPSIDTPSVVQQWTLIPRTATSATTNALKTALTTVCQQFGATAPGPNTHHYVELGSAMMRWEQHTEFSTIVLMAQDKADLDHFPTDWLHASDHQLLTGCLILIHAEASSSLESDATEGLVGGLVLSERAEIATNLRPNVQQMVQYRIINRGLDNAGTGRLVQRLYEIETYRMMALMGLPLAKQTTQTLNALDGQLIGLVERLSQTADLSQDQELLEELFKLAQDSEQLTADTDYRFSATQAYGRIVKDRMAELNESALSSRQSLREFLERRFEPALRTTAHVSQRQENLSVRIARTVSLARTRVEVSLQTQHRTQLEAMAKRAQLQLRLQRTVEGLSVMAISYYTIGILAYLMGGWLPTNGLKLLISIISPLLLLTVWWLLKRWRKQLLEEDDSPT